MAWQIRSLPDASARVRGAFRKYMPGTDSALLNNFVTVLGKVLAGMAHEFELRMAWLAKQMFLSSATSEQFIIQLCSDVGIYRKAASKATGLSVTGTGLPEATYPAGIRFISGSNTYLSSNPATADTLGNVSFPVVSETVGATANRDAGGLLALADPVLYPELSTIWTVGDAGIGGGADVESIEEMKARGLYRKQNPPGGGKLTDYEDVVLSVPGVLKAWAFRDPYAPGFLVVLFLFKGRPNLIPTAGDVLVVQSAIDAKRLIRIDDSVAAAPVAFPIDITINGLRSDTADVRAAIAAGLTDMLYDRGRPGIAGDTFTLSLSWIEEAISTATGEDRHVLAWPLDDVTLTNGKYPVLGAITYGA
ncbi:MULTISPECIES: baseplate J/gp47 family protein [unclassified Rhizobium]|uniref:baseplate J/gp47 family protein n=1 Tax=unclassified Rhizobium TaxID=2613769 RepID=UPI00146C9CE4|nr:MULTISPECIES: baseplate J/gp47 family protein [unclassified Rhizobium]MBD9445752.1 baseplate J/gp47 family protein [Rhizobium sp. RHZ01]NMN73852.1 putative phage protein gp47/JayE [Rhizobium sp. 57MFTsu3.2]